MSVSVAGFQRHTERDMLGVLVCALLVSVGLYRGLFVSHATVISISVCNRGRDTCVDIKVE